MEILFEAPEQYYSLSQGDRVSGMVKAISTSKFNDRKYWAAFEKPTGGRITIWLTTHEIKFSDTFGFIGHSVLEKSRVDRLKSAHWWADLVEYHRWGSGFIKEGSAIKIHGYLTENGFIAEDIESSQKVYYGYLALKNFCDKIKMPIIPIVKRDIFAKLCKMSIAHPSLISKMLGSDKDPSLMEAILIKPYQVKPLRFARSYLIKKPPHFLLTRYHATSAYSLSLAKMDTYMREEKERVLTSNSEIKDKNRLSGLLFHAGISRIKKDGVNPRKTLGKDNWIVFRDLCIQKARRILG